MVNTSLGVEGGKGEQFNLALERKMSPMTGIVKARVPALLQKAVSDLELCPLGLRNRVAV